MRRKMAAGNWKMNGLRAQVSELAKIDTPETVDVVICPPATLLTISTGGPVQIGAQDCHTAVSGAHTGDVSAQMIRDAGASYVILGHSERRADHAETDELVRAKTVAVWSEELTAIICVGETLEDREAGRTLDVVLGQLAGSVPGGATAANTVIAYEPVWAIGTGHVPTLEQIGEVHTALRAALVERFDEGDGMRLLYGGSVKPGNASEIFGVADVDGALVGGASLKAADFNGIIAALV